MVCARAGMGKTTLMIKLMINYWIKQFDKIYIICPTFAEDKNWSFFDPYVESGQVEVFDTVDERQLNRIWNTCKKAKVNDDPNAHYLIYFDDCTGQPAFKKNQETGVVNMLFSKGRHANISIIIVVQKFTQASTTMRVNADCFLTFMTMNCDEKNYMYKEFGYGEKKKFIKLLDDCTIEPYHHMYINRQGPGAPPIYHNFKLVKYK